MTKKKDPKDLLRRGRKVVSVSITEQPTKAFKRLVAAKLRVQKAIEEKRNAENEETAADSEFFKEMDVLNKDTHK